MKTVSEIAKKIKGKKELAQEVSYYSDLEDFIEVVSLQGEDLGLKVQTAPRKKKCGYPDIQIIEAASGNSLGFIEVKLPGADLSENGPYKTQFSKYKEYTPNLIITDINHWQLWQWDNNNNSKKKLEGKWDFEKHPNEYSEIRKILEVFNAKKPIVAEDPEELANLLARRNKSLREVVEEIYVSDHCPQNLKDLFETIREFLIKDITVHDYVNMYAETITYSLFIARLQHFKKGEKEDFNIDSAFSFLHRRLPQIPLLDELYNKANEELVAKIEDEIDLIIQDLKLCDIGKIYKIFTKHDPDKDPIIYFYEPFVKFNDPETKIKRGVFYTPKPIANFITKSINVILKEKFGLQEGLANENVHLLDPAMGTGTFLVASIERIYEDLKERYKNQGTTFLRQKWEKVVQNHILERFYGFEILLAPYVIAHLKLSLYLEENGYEFESTNKNKKFKLYLTNTLENEEHNKQVAHYGQIAKEGKAASEIKNQEPVLVITGNPPYSVSSFNKSEWIEDLMDLYKTAVRGERNIQPLSDDYIKFIRFAQWKINKTGHGIFAMITNHSFLDGKIHRGMREELMKEYDQIYVLDLHGNATIHELNPDGGIDQNVFNSKQGGIKQGVAISLFIKSNILKEKGVWYSELWGNSEGKLQFLNKSHITSVDWEKIKPEKTKNFFFRPKVFNMLIDYEKFFDLREIFQENKIGIATGSDNRFVKFDRDDFEKNFDSTKIRKYSYRLFDDRYIYFQPKMLQRARFSIMQHLLRPNLALTVTKQLVSETFRHIFVSSAIADRCLMSQESREGNYFFPLYHYGENGLRNANLNARIIHEIEKNVGKITPEDIFYYIYGVLHSNNYREKYKEFLKIDFPRIPYPKDKKGFGKLVKLGKYLTDLHLMGENPLSQADCPILNKPGFWNVKIITSLKNFEVQKIHYDLDKKRVYINKETYFDGVEGDVWDFFIGGYQVLDKWLKYRKGRNLTLEDQEHFMKMVVILRETLKTMKEIDLLVIQQLEVVEQPKIVTPKTGARQKRRETVERIKAKRPVHAKSGTGAKSRKSRMK